MPKSSIKNPQRAVATTRRPTPRRARTPAPGSHPRPVRTLRAPMTVSSRIEPYFSQSVSSGVTTIRGRDLVIPELTTVGNASVLGRIPFSPRLWYGTRISVLASTFASHRPKRVVIHYQAGIGTTAVGSIFYGTFAADTAIPAIGNSLTQSLVASSGGSTPVWSPCSFNVPLVGLQRPWYECEGITEDSIPFITYIATANVPSGSMIGAIWVEYEWEFCRPLVGSTFLASNLQTYYDLVPRKMSTVAASDVVTFVADAHFPVGQALMVSPCGKIANYIYANPGSPNIGDWINAGVDFLAETLSATTLHLLDDNGDALSNSVTTAENWAFLARAVLGTLL